MKLVYLLAVLVTAEAKARPQSCSVSDWTAWSEWTTGTNRHDIKSFAVPDDVHPTFGSKNRKETMKFKAEALMEKDRCTKDGTCPEFAYLPSEGFSACTQGYAGVPAYPCENIDQMSFVSFEDMKIIQDANFGIRGNDIWGWTSSSGREYAIMGTTHATSFVDVTDAGNAIPIGVLNRPAGTNAMLWRDVKVVGDTAYVVSEALGSGVQSFDLNRLESVTEFTYFTEDHHFTDLSNCHNIVVNEATKMLYAVGCLGRSGNLCQGGLYILDATEPLAPKFVTCYGADGYVHDAECVVYHGPDTDYTDHEICFSYNEDTFTIVDLEDKANIQILSRTAYVGARYTHQGIVSEDHSIALTDDELDERRGDPYTKTYVWDIQSLTSPVLKTVYFSSQTSIDHNQYVVGDFTYQANYESGLRILKLNGFDLIPVAHFDVLPSRTRAAFAGAWSVYPYFNSGNVIVSSIDYGLFVLRPDMAAMEKAAAERSDVTERQRFRQILEASDITACPTLSQTERA